MLMKGPFLELSLRGILENNLSQNLFQTAMYLQRIHLKIFVKNGMFNFKVFLLFRVRAAGERAT